MSREEPAAPHEDWPTPDNGGGRASSLLPLVYEELHLIAERRLRNLPPGASLHPTELLHEAYARLVRYEDASFATRRHFVAAAALAMRSVLVDRARARASLKRGGGAARVPLDGLAIDENRPADEVLAVDAALTKLESIDERSARVVILRFYLGLNEQQIAHVLDVTDRTVRRDWIFAKHWLQRELHSQKAAPSSDTHA